MNRQMYTNAVLRIALSRDQPVSKVCFGRLDLLGDKEQVLDDLTLDYNEFKLARASVPLKDVSTFVSEIVERKILRLKGLEVPVDGNLSPPSRGYVASLETYGTIRPEWPSTLLYLQVQGGYQGNAPSHPLVKLGLPSFVSGDEAVREFCGLVSGFNQGQVIFVFPDYRARIRELRILEGKLCVDVESRGESLDKLRVKFYVHSEGKSSKSPDLELAKGHAEFAFNGSPNLAMVHLLSIDSGDHIDNRIFAPYYARGGIVIEASETRVLEMIRNGEGLKAEFKELLPPDLHRFLDSVVAFANTKGGSILVGVNNEGEIKGIQNDNDVRTTILQWNADKCDPPAPVNLTSIQVEGRNLVLVDIQEGTDKPYQDRDKGFYVRRGASNRQATRSEVLAMARSSQSQPPF
jgi:hypothetical protein